MIFGVNLPIGVFALDAGQHDVEQRHEHHAHADPADDHRGQQIQRTDSGAGAAQRLVAQQPGRLPPPGRLAIPGGQVSAWSSRRWPSRRTRLRSRRRGSAECQGVKPRPACSSMLKISMIPRIDAMNTTKNGRPDE